MHDRPRRSRTISSSTTAGTACGLRWGRRERGSVGGLALDLPAFDQLLDPVPRDVVVAVDLALGASLHHDRRDDQSGLPRGPTCADTMNVLTGAKSGRLLGRRAML